MTGSRFFTPWTNEKVEKLTQLWLDGYSASQCAEQLGGVTRNAVISKVHREGISARTKARSPRQAQRAWKPRQGAKAGKATERLSVINGRRKRMGADPYETLAEFYLDEDRRTAELAALEAMPEVDVPLAERKGILVRDGNGKLCANDALDATACRWPIGDPQKLDEFHFCNGKAVPGLPYCPQHNARAFRPVEPVRRQWSKSNPLLWRTGGADHTYTTDIRTMELADK